MFNTSHPESAEKPLMLRDVFQTPAEVWDHRQYHTLTQTLQYYNGRPTVAHTARCGGDSGH